MVKNKERRTQTHTGKNNDEMGELLLYGGNLYLKG
jgi:hypothetical protein